MTLEEVPFKIGMQYENWEFDLEPIETTKYYDKYEYIKGDITSIFYLDIKNIFLYFNLDILYKVELMLTANQTKITLGHT